MSDHHPHDDRDRDSDDERGRRDAGRADPPGVVRLDLNVGIQPLTDLLGGVLGASASSHRGEWQPVDDVGRRGDHADSQAPGAGRRARDADRRADDARSVDRDGRSDALDAPRDESVEVADDFLVETHRDGDEFVVTAELPGVDEEDLSVGIDVRSNDFVVAADGRTIDRVDLPWPTTDAARVWYNNGVLEARLRPADDEGDAGGS
jgi:HSP20 family molecular chaperone IbpA